MKLTRAILSGFKSFADRTEFDFDAGISCIVGPNGCGKSNIVDAIKWVLGEQSAKSLRGGEMRDVIFNGSTRRKPAGMAQVTLVFDNTDGVLQPAPNGEADTSDTVAVTRRLYRSGQSEYLINKTPCRLRDIKEMFLDTGIGAGAYSLIEQGRVSQLLNASQDERRAFFDEAAGISRYKRRRLEAQRKLDRTEQNLFRVEDILREVDKQLRSIKIQAGKARNYQAYSQHLKELRSLYLLAQYHRMKQDRATRQAELEREADRLAAVQAHISRLENSQSSAEVENVELEEAARNDQSRIATLDSQMNTLTERVEMQTRRSQELGDQIVAHASNVEELEARLDETAKDHAQRQVELDRVASEADDVQAQAEAKREEFSAGEMRQTRLESDLEDERQGVTDLLRRVTQLHNEVRAITVKRENLHGERDRIERQAEDIADELEGLFEERAELEAGIADAEEIVEQTETKLADVKQSLGDLEGDEQHLQAELLDARERRSNLTGRMNTLTEMQKNLDGVAEGTRKVLEAQREGRINAVHGMLGDFIQTDTEHAMLVAAALAGADQRLLATHYGEVQAHVEELEAILGEGGSAEIFCLDRIASAPSDDVTVSPPQAMARVMDWVTFEPWLEPIIWHLLGHTLVVPTLADARLAADVCPEDYRFVTLAGEVYEPEGLVRLAAASQGGGLIARRSELAEIDETLAHTEAIIETLSRQAAETREQREHLDGIVHSLRTSVYEATYERQEATKRLETLNQRIEDLKRQAPLVAQNLEGLEKDIEESVRREHDTKQKAEELETIKAQRDEHIAQLQQQLAAGKSHQADLGEELTGLKVRVAAAEQRRQALREQVDTLAHRKQEQAEQLEHSREAIQLDRTRKAEAEAEAQRAGAAIGDLRMQKEQLEDEYNEIEESRRSIAERLDEVRRELRSHRAEAEQVSSVVGDLRVKLGEIDAHVADISNRASDEMGMDLATLYEEYDHDDERDWDAVEADIADLRGKIERLGNVNMDAIEEQDDLEHRYEFLQGQIEDITSSQRQLEELIRRLNRESRDRFAETFKAVRENFQALFRKLFGGGKADIFLIDPENELESGIEIVARPPGKELRSISLLSGGERAMTAIALVFSFFQARPSPFCVLDEVDAPLDEANTGRYGEIVKEFSKISQFIMITHAKRTMAFGDVLYGVTMQEPGVSTPVSVRFEEAAEMIDDQPVAAGA
ncbi:MAG: chromosome segregation protein SMC [Planctomycetes bacterium]|jgi:chromosome segregation protein|nr:chromosome segregation protein SMC [Phycisphaerae bacterium]NBB95230.1 chromosome segregation protein SMC [Planctomycetota bacterium]